MIRTADQAQADIDLFQPTETCGVCHPRQLEELTGSMHLASHTDPLYRAMAELARKEAGPKVYAFCAGCHSPAGVLTGLIPAKPDEQLPAEAKAGVNCDVCHQISALTGATGPWKEPANASFTIQQGMVKFGNYGNVAENRSHSGEKKDFFATSELCASCHTVIQPMNGFPYRGHLRRVEGGGFFPEGDSVPGLPHANRRRGPEGGGDAPAAGAHGKIRCRRGGSSDLSALLCRRQCERRHPCRWKEPRPNGRGAIERRGPAGTQVARRKRRPARNWSWTCWFTTSPPAITFPRPSPSCGGCGSTCKSATPRARSFSTTRAWTSTAIRGPGPSPSEPLRAIKAGKPTFKLWEMTQFLWKRTIPPKSFAQDTVRFTLPADASGPLTVEARLLYQSASPQVVAEIMGKEAFTPKVVEMATARTTVNLAGP